MVRTNVYHVNEEQQGETRNGRFGTRTDICQPGKYTSMVQKRQDFVTT